MANAARQTPHDVANTSPAEANIRPMEWYGRSSIDCVIAPVSSALFAIAQIACGDTTIAATTRASAPRRDSNQWRYGATVLEAVVATESALILDPACPTLVVAGSIEAIVGDASNHEILSITWNGCDASGTELLNP